MKSRHAILLVLLASVPLRADIRNAAPLLASPAASCSLPAAAVVPSASPEDEPSAPWSASCLFMLNAAAEGSPAPASALQPLREVLHPARMSAADAAAGSRFYRDAGPDGADARDPAAAGWQVRELPPAPDSRRLGASGLALLLAWSVVRSAGRMHFGHLPAWYAPGRAQVRHALAFDPNQPEPTAIPIDDPQHAMPRFAPARERVTLSLSPPVPSCILAVVGPRAPPV